MSRCEIERNAEITMMRKEGATFREIAEWYEVTVARAQQIYEKFKKCGHTKEEIGAAWERKQEIRKEKEAELEAWIQKREGGRHYVIMNGAEDLYLTKIEPADKHPPVYRYSSADIRDALWFTMEEARKIARERKARVIWVPRISAI